MLEKWRNYFFKGSRGSDKREVMFSTNTLMEGILQSPTME